MIERRFNKSKIKFRKLSTKRIVVAILAGLASTFIIYSFSSVLRESIRMTSMIDVSSPIIVEETNRYFYNLFFAVLSFIYGSSITIALVFSRKQLLLESRSNKRKRILNDQVFLNFNFAYVFFKLLVLFGAFYFGEVFHDSIREEFMLIAALLLIVLFLDIWKALAQTLGRTQYKYQLIHLSIIILLSFGLSHVNIVDYNSIDEILLKNNPVVAKPYSEFYDKIDRRYPVIFFKLLPGKNGNLDIYFNREKIELKDISSILISERNMCSKDMHHFFQVAIEADKNLDLIKIKSFEAKLFAVSQFKIIYITTSLELNSRDDSKGITNRITSDVMHFMDLNTRELISPIFRSVSRVYIKDTIRIKVDNNGILKKYIYEVFKDNVNKNLAFQYDISSETSYQDYINVLSIHYKVVHEFRKKEQRVNDKSSNWKLYNKEQRVLKGKYPMIIIENYLN